MNAVLRPAPSATRTPAVVPPIARAAAARYRERDFGIGYGASSGYAQARRYTSDWGQSRFRCG